MLRPRSLRRLTLDPAAHPRGQPHLSSASGLARVGRYLYIVADDENHLARIDAQDPVASPLVLVPFAPRVLPADAAQRKAAKPDLESLALFPPARPGEGGLLVAWGSASRPQREFAYRFDLGPQGDITSPARRISLSALCEPLRRCFGELNLEAGFIQRGELHLFQRAHAGQPLNGHIRFDAGAIRAWLCEDGVEPPEPVAMTRIDLGRVDGVPLGITDAAASPDGGWVFSAVAEDTTDAYADGACVGSVLGWAGATGAVQGMERLQGDPKVEGLAFAGPDLLWLVTDADDPARASELLALDWAQ